MGQSIEFRRRPEQVQAVPYDGFNKHIIGAFLDREIGPLGVGQSFDIRVAPGEYKTVCLGEWIIRYPTGRLEVVSDEEFRRNWESVG